MSYQNSYSVGATLTAGVMSDIAPRHPLVWISERQAINPASVLWLFRGAHGELEIVFAGGKQLALNERDLSAAGRAVLLPTEERVRSIGAAFPER